MGRRIETGMTSWRQAVGMLLLGATVLAMTSCENLLSALISQDEEYQKQLLGIEEILPGQDRWITGHEVISIQFEEGVDTSSLTLGGTLGITEAELWVEDWSTDTHTMDTLHLNPERIGGDELWPEGPGTAIISVTSNTGKTITAQTLNFDVEYALCVDDVADADEDGSVNHPFDTIQEGIDAVASVYSPGSGTTIPVRVAVGDYEEYCNYSTSTWVAEMADHVSLHGGYHGNFLSLDGSNETVLIDEGNNGGSGVESPTSVVYCGPSVSGTPLIENLTLESGGSGGGFTVFSALHIDGSSPVIRNVTTTGKISDGPGYVLGVLVEGACTPAITDCSINPGHASSVSIGLYVYDDAAPSVSGSNTANHFIDAGDGVSEGVAVFYDGSAGNGSGSFTGIGIIGPDTGTTTGGIFTTMVVAGACVYITGGNPSFDNVTFVLDLDDDDLWVVYENTSDSDPSSFSGNDFALGSGSSSLFWYYDDDKSLTVTSSNYATAGSEISFSGTSALLMGTGGHGNYSSTLPLDDD